MAGLKNKEIAEQLGWSASKVSVTLSDPRADVDRAEFAGKVADRLTDTHLKLRLLTHEAVDAAADVMRNGEKDADILRASFGLLDRAGYTPIQKTITASLKEDAPTEIFDRMKEVTEEINLHSRRYHTPTPTLVEDAEEVDFEVIEPGLNKEKIPTITHGGDDD